MRIRLAVGINTPSAPGCEGRPRRFEAGEVVELPDQLVAEFAAMRPPAVELQPDGSVLVVSEEPALSVEGASYEPKPRRAAKREG